MRALYSSYCSISHQAPIQLLSYKLCLMRAIIITVNQLCIKLATSIPLALGHRCLYSHVLLTTVPTTEAPHVPSTISLSIVTASSSNPVPADHGCLTLPIAPEPSMLLSAIHTLLSITCLPPLQHGVPAATRSFSPSNPQPSCLNHLRLGLHGHHCLYHLLPQTL